jgi:hypothetical protein
MKPWKVQKFFEDVVYDLRSRGLLPVVILLVVAMVAVPVLITRGSSDTPEPSLQPTAGVAESAPEAQTAVVSYNPGIRDYKRRLNQLSSKDPFRQQFAQPAADASKLTTTNNAVPAPSSGSGSGTASTGSAGSDTTVSGGDSTGGGKKRKKPGSKTTYSYSVNVMAGDVNTTLTPFKDVASLTPLPSQTSPVVVYYGLSQDNKQALFLVSNKVDTLSGPGTCVPAPDDCSLLSLAPGQSEDLHYAQDGKTYRVVVAEIKRTAK